jgi:ABC-type lipoprotein release transport system permease subunit
MGAVTLLLRVRLRLHWRSWLALAVLVALVGGFVMAAAVTARRTAAALPDFVARHGYDALVYSSHPLPGLARIPQTARVTRVLLPFTFPGRCVSCSRQIGTSESFSVFEVPPARLPRVSKLLSGRMPDQSNPDEVLASYTLARDNGVHIGSVIRVLTPTPAQLQLAQKVGRSHVNIAMVPRRDLRVVGLVVAENELHSGQGSRYDLFTTRAYAAAVNPGALVWPSYYVQLRRGAADLPAFDSQLRPLGSAGADDLDLDAAGVQGSIRPQAVGWWVLAALAALAGLAVLGQAAARQFVTEQDDRQALSAVGLRAWQFVALGLARAAVIGAAGAAGAVALATLLSPLTPVGEARLASSSAGAVVFDPLVMVIGALATVATLVALSAWPAVRDARLLRRSRPKSVPVALVRAVAWSGAPPSALIGVRYALQRGRGRQPVPVGTALLGMVLAVAALCATAVFGASLTRLTSTPALYGVPFQAEFSYQGGGSPDYVTGPVLTSLRRDRAIARITLADFAAVDVNGHQIRLAAVTAIRGPALISVIDGRQPSGDHEIMLGAATMRSVGAQPGGLVRVTVTDPEGTRHQAQFRVVGRASFAPGFYTGGLGSGAAMTISALTHLQCPAGADVTACQRNVQRGTIYTVLVRAAPGPHAAAALARHVSKYGEFLVSGDQEPAELVNFGESVNFPLLFGGLLALFGAATMVHLLVISVSRRRGEAGLLKVLGFVRYQVAAVVSWQATVVAMVGIVAGVPLGIAAGRAVWRVFATNFGVVSLTVVNVLLIATLAVGVLAAANVLAFFPALLAARSRPAQLLRAE